MISTHMEHKVALFSDNSFSPDRKLSLAEILCSLSFALDLTEGQPMGHAQRTCLIGMQIASVLGLPECQVTSLFHALLIKDAGCTSNAARMYAIFGADEVTTRCALKVGNWNALFEAAKYAVDRTFSNHSLPNHSLWMRLHLRYTPRPTTTNALKDARGEQGAQIARNLGLGEDAACCIQSLNEHWDGRGVTQRLRGDAIPLLARIACLAQTLEVFVSTYDVKTAYQIVRRRSGTWFDPSLVQAACSFQHDELFWRFVQAASRDRVLSLEAEAVVEIATEERIDAICDAFAQIVDAKSPFTAEHSSRVCTYSTEIADMLGVTGEQQATLRRAALLHDIGKLAIPTQILDKPGKLTPSEWERMKRHPRYTEEILSQITGFSRLAKVAGAHHERLNGTGYFRGLSAKRLDLEMRIIAVADVFDALLAQRPYRLAIPLAQAFAILDKEADVSLDGQCIEVLKQKYANAPLSSLPKPEKQHLLAA